MPLQEQWEADHKPACPKSHNSNEVVNMNTCTNKNAISNKKMIRQRQMHAELELKALCSGESDVNTVQMMQGFRSLMGTLTCSSEDTKRA